MGIGRSVALCIALVAGAGCDPGYLYTPLAPVGGTADSLLVHERDFVLMAPRLQGLIGEWWLYPDFELQHVTRRVAMRAAWVRAEDGQIYPAVRWASWPTVATPDNRVRRPPWKWDFGEGHPAPDVLGRTCSIEFVFDADDGYSDTVRVTYRRTR